MFSRLSTKVPIAFWCTSVLFTLVLTLSPPIPLRLYTLPYWSNSPFLIFDIRRSGAQDWAPSARMSITKNGGLDQYGAGLFEQQQFGTAGVEGVKSLRLVSFNLRWCVNLSLGLLPSMPAKRRRRVWFSIMSVRVACIRAQIEQLLIRIIYYWCNVVGTHSLKTPF